MRIFSIAVILFASLSACQQADFYDTNGNGYQDADLQDKFLLVNYWATWCSPCVKEIPELNEFAASHKQQLNIFGVDYDHPEGDKIQANVRKMKIEFPVYAEDPAPRLGISKPEVLPTTFIFTPDGKLMATLVGPQTLESLKAAMKLD